MSFVHVENVRFDNQNVITDINLRNESGKITTNTSYQKRQMPKGDIDSTEKTFHSESIEATIKRWMDYIDSSYVCQGFLVKDTDNVYGDPVSKHSITYTEDGIKETEMRGFSSHCEVLSNSEGECCSMCSKTKDNLRRKHFRLEEYKDRPLFHRDVTTSTCQGSSSSFKWKIYRNWEQQRIRRETKFRARC